MSTGTITQIIGSVIDVHFAEGLPAIKNALTISMPSSAKATKGENDRTIVLEVVQHLGLNRARCISMKDTAGLARETAVEDTGAPISVPVGESSPGRMVDR